MLSTGWLTANASPVGVDRRSQFGLLCCSVDEPSSLKLSKFRTQDSQTSGQGPLWGVPHEPALCKTTQGSEAQQCG